jgi:hypothetical protein
VPAAWMAWQEQVPWQESDARTGMDLFGLADISCLLARRIESDVT